MAVRTTNALLAAMELTAQAKHRPLLNNRVVVAFGSGFVGLKLIAKNLTIVLGEKDMGIKIDKRWLKDVLFGNSTGPETVKNGSGIS